MQRAHRRPICDPTLKKVRLSHRDCQGPHHAPEAAIRSAWEEAYADLDPENKCLHFTTKPTPKAQSAKTCCQHKLCRRITKDAPSSGLTKTCYHCYHPIGGSHRLYYDRTDSEAQHFKRIKSTSKQVAPVQHLCSMAMRCAKSWQDTPRMGHKNAACGLAHSYSPPGTWFQDAASKLSAKEYQICTH